MKKILLSSFVWAFWCATLTTAQDSPVGVWKTIDDKTGEPKAWIEIYEQEGKYYGKIVKLLQKPPDTVCDKCPGDKKGKPLIGMIVLWDLQPYKYYWSYGKILDPNNGKIYKCSVWFEDSDKLKVRGYIGVSAIGRTQTWHRVK